MEDHGTIEWWRWRMYRQVAAYINDPIPRNESQLRVLIDEYREYRSDWIVSAGNDGSEPSADCG